MNKILGTNISFIQRCISTTTANRRHTAGKMFAKFLRKNSGKHDRKWYNYTSPKPDILGVRSSVPSQHVKRRMTVLNKIFMQHITDIMSTDNHASELVNRGIETTHVNITASFADLHIFWIDNSRSKEYSAESQKLLDEYAPLLRDMLTHLRVISNVPKIRFLQDKAHMELKETNYRLSLISRDLDTQIENRAGTKEALLLQIPEMKNDIFGLNHAFIMSKIVSNLNKKAKNIVQQRPKENVLSNNEATDHQNNKVLLTEYLRQKKINERKKYNEKRKLMPNAELEEYSTDNTDEDSDYDSDDGDYYSDDGYHASGDYDDLDNLDDKDKHYYKDDCPKNETNDIQNKKH